MSKIRVGLIRCDTHGMWFGPQMMAHDARLLEHPTDDRELLNYESRLRRGVISSEMRRSLTRTIEPPVMARAQEIIDHPLKLTSDIS